MYTCREERYPARRPSSSAHGQPISINPVSDQIGARSERIYAASDRIYTSGSLRPTCPLARGGKLYPRIGSNREKFRFSQVFFVFRIFGRGEEEGAEQGSCKGKGEGWVRRVGARTNFEQIWRILFGKEATIISFPGSGSIVACKNVT